MGISNIDFPHHRKVTAAIARVRKKFPKDVVRITYSLGKDWEGEPTMFFDVVISDEARQRVTELGQLGRRISFALDTEVRSGDYGFHKHLRLRSRAEYEASKMREDIPA